MSNFQWTVCFYFSILYAGAPKIKRFDGRLPFIEIQNHQGNLTFEMTGYPTPQIQSKVRHGSTVNNSHERSSVDDRIHVSCAARQFAPASVTCNITTVNVIKIDQSLYQIDFKNSLGETSFNFSLKRKGKYRWSIKKIREILLMFTALQCTLLRSHYTSMAHKLMIMVDASLLAADRPLFATATFRQAVAPGY